MYKLPSAMFPKLFQDNKKKVFSCGPQNCSVKIVLDVVSFPANIFYITLCILYSEKNLDHFRNMLL